MAQYITYSENETKALAAKIAQGINSGVIALTGELGAGKTTFTQGFARGLNIKDKIISPTFVLIRQHQIPKTNKILYHIDLYRIEDFKGLGLEEIWSNPNNIVLIEWAEKTKELLPKNTIYINFKALDKNKREITLS